jgi:acyl-CoA synthetase (AMP-forming)/AMP-acid ligase II
MPQYTPERDRKMLLTDYLVQSARLYPGHEIIVQGKRRISYEVMFRRVMEVASFLRSEGIVAVGDRVGVCMENSPEYLLVYFGILEAGGAVVPISHQTTSRGMQHVLGDCGTTALFVQESLLGLVKEALPAIPTLKSVIVAGKRDIEEHCDGTTVKKHPIADRQQFYLNEIGFWDGIRDGNRQKRGKDLALILYTSGTTSEPKGVMLSHRNLTANAESIVEYLGLTAKDCAMVVLPFYYSYGNSLLTTHVMAGGTLVLENSFVYPNVVIDKMTEERVTGFSGVPSTFAILLHRSKIRDVEFPALRYVTQAGGPMSPVHAQELKKVMPKADIYIMYGQTEATARLTYLAPKDLSRKAGSIGKSIPGVTIMVQKPDGTLVAPGETGEIVAEGENIMMGYWNRPEETASVLNGGRLHTGDMARIDEEGYFFIVGRKSEMIKSGAHRISPKEIEEVILEIPGIHEVAVVGVKDEIMGEVIHAYVVLKENHQPDAKVISAYCRKNLPPYKIPKTIHFFASLPKTHSGKIKKHELRGEDLDART